MSQDGWAATQDTVTPTETPEKLEPAAKRPKSKTYDISLKIAPPGMNQTCQKLYRKIIKLKIQSLTKNLYFRTDHLVRR